MARPPTVSNQVLIQVFASNNSYAETAETVGLDPSTVRKRLKRLKINGAKNVALESAGALVMLGVDAFGQIIKINNHANRLLDVLMKWCEGDEEAIQILEKQKRTIRIGSTVDGETHKIHEFKFKDPRELALKTMAEIRGQLKTQLDYMNCLYDLKANAEFQQAVIDSIGECAPEVKRAILNKLQSERAIRASVQF